MRKFLLLIGMMAMAGAISAATFEWTDSQGGAHFTDDPDNIPARYRNKARQIEVSPVVEEGNKAGEGEKTTTRGEDTLVGGHDEAWWRERFKALHDATGKIQDGLKEKKESLAAQHRKYVLFSKSSDRVAENDLAADIYKDEARLARLQKKLADLDEAATRAGVPLEWRK